MFDTAQVSARAKITTVDRRPKWSDGVDVTPVAALCILRCADELLFNPAALEPHGVLPVLQAALEALTTYQDVALFCAWSCIYLRWCALL